MSKLTEQIERLQDNKATYRCLSGDDRAIFDGLNKKIDTVYLDDNGEWLISASDAYSLGDRYRIHRNYQPTPDKPVFPGMVLRELKPESDSKIKGWGYYDDNRTWQWLSRAVDFGCCGYNFAEAPDILWNSPIAFVTDSGGIGLHCTISDADVDGMKPATLKYCAFPESDG